ncbi:hypothetical protein EXIGLDRAFT_30792 [Exidia glandulosa HHB12029]|uniref:Uncharacterized protein n=1 Tax=Exidia glandulosa HHB12029 TaxID=1314781 RepID=A0A165IVP2_EXIGL|nr:hypothetical protein EXIGLDRAFT_30792 [Exidia glandulosa HHB12029]
MSKLSVLKKLLSVFHSHPSLVSSGVLLLGHTRHECAQGRACGRRWRWRRLNLARTGRRCLSPFVGDAVVVVDIVAAALCARWTSRGNHPLALRERTAILPRLLIRTCWCIVVNIARNAPSAVHVHALDIAILRHRLRLGFWQTALRELRSRARRAHCGMAPEVCRHRMLEHRSRAVSRARVRSIDRTLAPGHRLGRSAIGDMLVTAPTAVGHQSCRLLVGPSIRIGELYAPLRRRPDRFVLALFPLARSRSRVTLGIVA